MELDRIKQFAGIGNSLVAIHVKLYKTSLAAIQRTRIALVTKANSEFEVACPAIIREIRVPHVQTTTVVRGLVGTGQIVQARTPRERPPRQFERDRETTDVCKRLRLYPDDYFLKLRPTSPPLSISSRQRFASTFERVTCG